MLVFISVKPVRCLQCIVCIYFWSKLNKNKFSWELSKFHFSDLNSFSAFSKQKHEHFIELWISTKIYLNRRKAVDYKIKSFRFISDVFPWKKRISNKRAFLNKTNPLMELSFCSKKGNNNEIIWLKCTSICDFRAGKKQMQTERAKHPKVIFYFRNVFFFSYFKNTTHFNRFLFKFTFNANRIYWMLQSDM